MPTPDQLPAWKSLGRLSAAAADPDFGHRSLELPGMLVDFSKQRADDAVLRGLIELAHARGLPEQVRRLFEGEHVNVSEDRPALHTALRAGPAEQPIAAGQAVAQTRARLARLARDLRSGVYRGFTGRAIRDIVHIGIGGSHLGPELAVEALADRVDGAPRCRFVANIDGEALRAALDGLNPETTLFVIVSKSFSTLETRVNALSARSWFLERTGSLAAIAQHFMAVTANVAAAAEFGMPEQNLYPMWDWVGGRFSLWSAVGLPVALTAGPEAFDALLRGAHDLDVHFRTAPLERNGPALMALLGIWNYNFRGVATQAVLPYSRRLRLLPDYLQQLEMESNGKSVHTDGTPVSIHTMPVVWGGEGTNGQHAFHQLLHQGTRAFAADFILTATPEHDLAEHHRWLLANGLAQSQAMLLGQQADDPHRRVAGDKPSTTIVLDRLTPYALGALLALYEHKVFCQGVIWDINSFDQWGVEIGKRLAPPIFDQLGGASTAQQDASTRGLVGRLRQPRVPE